LQTHRLAEEAAVVGGAGENEFPASEQVYPWIAADIIAADRSRLYGLDYLISNVAEDWPKGEGLLKTAADQYRAILARAKQVGDAMTERNRTLAELPYYGRWVAGLRNEFDEGESRKLLELVERVAEATHRLSSLLEDAKPANLSDMPRATAAVKSGMTEL